MCRMEPSSSAEPKQERSRLSFDKAVDAAVALLIERGSDAFTLNEVAARPVCPRARSTGGWTARTTCCGWRMRGRWHGSAQRRTVVRHECPRPTSRSRTRRRGRRRTSRFLRDNAAVMSPFMRLANSDPMIADADAVDGATAGRGRDPRAGPVRHTIVWPVLERREECVLDRLLGGVEVAAERRDEARQHASAFGAEDVLHRRGGDQGGRLRVAFRHACSIGRSIPGASIRRITDDDPPYRMSEWRSNDEGDAAVHGHGQRGDR